MKLVRKIMAILTTFMMVFGMGGTAFAANHTVSIAESDTHTYDVYQVFTGTLAEQGSYELGDPAWGYSVNETARNGKVEDFIDSITAENITEQQIADKVYDVLDTSKVYKEDVKRGTSFTLPTGYYIFVDNTELTGDYELDTKALHVVEVVNNISGLSIKWGTTEDQKKIVSDTLGTGTTKIDGSIDNVSIGDTVNFQITAKVPANATNYNYFYFVINDTLDAGLTLDVNTIKVYKVEINDNNLLTQGDDKDYQLKTVVKPVEQNEPSSFQVGLNKAKEFAGKDIIVTYSAVLNENANIGIIPNTNTSTVNYSRDPNETYDGTNYPAFPKDVTDDAIGVTPATKTETFTTGLKIKKVDEDGNVLTGAKFKLTGESVQKVITTSETFAEAEDGTYYKLKDGTYTTTVPNSEYMELTTGATEGYVEDSDYTGADKIEVGGKTYRPYAPQTDEGKDVYVLHQANEDLYVSVDQKYNKTTNTVIKDSANNEEIEIEVGSDGIARFVGLGAGKYYIEETKTPAGYNTMDKMEVNIGFVVDQDGKVTWSFKNGKNENIGTFNMTEGILELPITNLKGTTLPSTGGIGTTIFYIVGGIMVAGAVVFLLTKRRIAGNE